jgi:hypothetical protein
MKPVSRIRVIRVMMDSFAHALLASAIGNGGWSEVQKVAEESEGARTDHDYRNRADRCEAGDGGGI